MRELTPEQRRQKTREFWQIVGQAKPITVTIPAGGAVAVIQQIQVAARTDEGRSNPIAPFVHGFAHHLTRCLPGPVAVEVYQGWKAPALPASAVPPAEPVAAPVLAVEKAAEPLQSFSPPTVRVMLLAMGKLCLAIGVLIAFRLWNRAGQLMAGR